MVATTLVGASLAVAPAASAGGCGSPDPRPANQTYNCDSRTYAYVYQRSYTQQAYTGGPWQTCYVFQTTAWSSSWGGTCALGQFTTTACRY